MVLTTIELAYIAYIADELNDINILESEASAAFDIAMDVSARHADMPEPFIYSDGIAYAGEFAPDLDAWRVTVA